MAALGTRAASAARKQLRAIDGGATLARKPEPVSAGWATRSARLAEDQGIDIGARFAQVKTSELSAEYDSDHKILWVRQLHRESASITPTLLRELATYQSVLKRLFAEEGSRARAALKYIVWMSDKQGVFNLGGDLPLFAGLVLAQDRDGLMEYARNCVEIVHQTMSGYSVPVVNIALVQGDALGGGFESILPNDVVIAERKAKFGLPEIIFGLFPGMGAYSFLSRRLGVVEAERMIRSARLFSAEEMQEKGIVDVLTDDGFGVERAIDYVSENSKRHNVDRALYQVRRRVHGVPLDELLAVAEIWVDTALEMDHADIRKMARLAEAQARRRMAVN